MLLQFFVVRCQLIQNTQKAVIRGDITSEEGAATVLETLDDISKEMPKVGWFSRLSLKAVRSRSCVRKANHGRPTLAEVGDTWRPHSPILVRDF
jgi:hypothetical protein